MVSIARQIVALEKNLGLMSNGHSDDPNKVSRILSHPTRWPRFGAALLLACLLIGLHPRPGVYVLRLFASDGELSAVDEVNVLVAIDNEAPTVNAGPDQTMGDGLLLLSSLES